MAIHRLGCVPGTVRFVCTKLGLEFLFWHPVSLISFWSVVGLFEGHSIPQIRRELRNDFLPTLVGEYCLWGPIDLINFWRVPVRYQVTCLLLSQYFCTGEADN
jgi:protein Mpv17